MSAPELARLQDLLQGYILRGAAGAEALVAGDARADAATRLGVYGDAYRLRLLEVLGSDYPVLRALAGEERFDALGLAYIEAHPSDTPSARWFGRHLPDFLRRDPDAAGEPILAELARFEWSQGEVFDAPGAEALELQAVAAVPPENWPAMRLLLNPASRRLDLRWNAPDLFKAHQAGKPLPAPRRKRQLQHWLLWRDAGLDLRWRPLSGDEAAALDAAAEGRSFGEICELLCEWTEPEQAPTQAAGLLKRWVVDGVVVELDQG
ncbi:MAG: DNA-binding domain-containing protein [Nevskia sp.]|nr:DNA-binding domain-containing protein [Nevskia sp.]